MCRCLAVAFAVAVSSAAIGAENDMIPLDGVAAYVNDHVITVSDVMAAMGNARADLVRLYRGEDLRVKLRESFDDARERLIERKLIAGAFDDEEGQLPGWAIDKRVEEIVRDSFGGDTARLVDALADDGLTMEEWRKALRERMIVQAMISAKVTANVRVGIREVRQAYDARKDEYGVPARAAIHMIVMSADSVLDGGVGAEAVRKRAVDGENFGALAREFSSGPRASGDGDWGEVELTSLRDEITDVVSRSDAGAITPVIEAGGFHYIVRVDSKREAGERPFEDVQAEIERDLRREASDALRAQWLDALRQKAYVKIVDVDIF